MAAKSKIEWTDSTWPVVTGCTPISSGCDHCYAATHAHRFTGTKAWPNGFDVTLWPDRLDQPMRWRAPRKVFVCSTGDLSVGAAAYTRHIRPVQRNFLVVQHVSRTDRIGAAA